MENIINSMDLMDLMNLMNNTNYKTQKFCSLCICDILNIQEIKISQNLFHCNICSFHYKYCEKYPEEKKIHKETGRNFFVDIVEYNIIKQQIRDQTIGFLMNYLKNFFE